MWIRGSRDNHSFALNVISFSDDDNQGNQRKGGLMPSPPPQIDLRLPKIEIALRPRGTIVDQFLIKIVRLNGSGDKVNLQNCLKIKTEKKTKKNISYHHICYTRIAHTQPTAS